MAEGTSNYLYFSLLKFTQTISFTNSQTRGGLLPGVYLLCGH